MDPDQFNGLGTNQLSDVYGEWLAANYLPEDEPFDLLLLNHADELTAEQRGWLEDFRAAWKAAEEKEDKWPRGDSVHYRCCEICDKWTARLGLGFHPATEGENYSPPLSRAWLEEYAGDMRYLFAQPLDPYAYGLAAFERAGLIEPDQA